MYEADGKGDKHAVAIGLRNCSMVLLITTKLHEKTISAPSDAQFTIIRHSIRGYFAGDKIGYKS